MKLLKPERNKKKNPSAEAIDSRRKRRLRKIDSGKEVDVRAQRKGTSIEGKQQTLIIL